MAPPNFLRSDPTDIYNGSPAVFVPSGAYVPEQWYDDRIFVSFARCCWPFRMLLRCEPVEGCARFHQNIPAQLLYRLSFTGGTARTGCVDNPANSPAPCSEVRLDQLGACGRAASRALRGLKMGGK